MKTEIWMAVLCFVHFQLCPLIRNTKWHKGSWYLTSNVQKVHGDYFVKVISERAIRGRVI